MALCLLPIPFSAVAAEGDGDSGGGGEASSTTFVTINGGTNTISGADSVGVSTPITNIHANNVTVYVDGDYNPQYLFSPRITELHMVNNGVGALWNPTLEELPTTFHAAVMKEAKLAILYDGWIDLENVGNRKPYGAQRYCEIMGYDLYARRGEAYGGGLSYSAVGGLYEAEDSVSYEWALMHLYRALGIEKIHYYAETSPVPEDYDINASPIVSALTMPTMGPDLSAGITRVAATRTNPDEYMPLAQADGFYSKNGAAKITVSDFCVLASELMHIYGEPVLTEQETMILLQAYGKDLPYGLSSRAVEAIKYLLARGIIEADMDWRSDLKFEDAATMLMRIKDKSSRLTFKEIELTADAGLLAKGFHPVEISGELSPIAVTERTETPYENYTTYDYLVECANSVQFKSASGGRVSPILCNGTDNGNGAIAGSEYLGIVTIDGKEFYHFVVEQTTESVVVGGSVHVNTTVDSDSPHRYILPAPGTDRNPGGIYLYKAGEPGSTGEQITSWTWSSLDDVGAPAEYCDKPRKESAVVHSVAQQGLFNSSTYGYTISVYVDDLDNVTFKDAADTDHTLSDVKAGTNPTQLPNNMSIQREAHTTSSKYVYFTVEGCSNKNTLTEIFTCKNKTAYQGFPAYSKMDNQFLVSVKFLQSIGAVWDFIKTGDETYYIGVSSQGFVYSSIFVNLAEDRPYAVRGTQLTIYPEDTVLVTEADADYYIDYQLILGASGAVKFENEDGNVSLSRCSNSAPLLPKIVYNANNMAGEHDWLWAPFVSVFDSAGVERKYIYAPAAYALANWVVVDNLADRMQAILSFYPSIRPNTDSAAAKILGDYLGLSVEGTGWNVYSANGPPLGDRIVDFKSDKFTLGEKVTFHDWLYVPALNAFLLEPYETAPGETYGSFVANISSDTEGTKAPLTSIVKVGNTYVDWNYNLYENKVPGTALYVEGEASRASCDISAWAGEKEYGTAPLDYSGFKVQAFAAVGVPALIGSPKANSRALANSKSVDTYSGIAYVVRNGKGYVEYQSTTDARIQYVLIHATPEKAYLQSAGFTFRDLDNSFRGDESSAKPDTEKGEATKKFDWAEYLRDVGLDDADDWLTILIIAVLNILPRIFMFLFIILLGLSLIADVKPWQIFCDKVFDPYRLLTLGRKTVHTIKVRMVFLFSLVALILYGLFQNGLILEIIAWIGRAVVGIIRR